ncbi:unnamed protein product [Euphydryas editha]|uniref:DUF5641 domain-containing protein n=1 Tax=Euphydryas editha TaxID=104508 RepID=A0AAU9V9W3_EUPED|nr:unnamed protein product [Euphydryas editha]
MPRLELCGALLGARLCNKVTQSLRLKVTCKFWCDSTIVLGWLQMPVHRLKPFVRNRVNEINEITAGYDWSYVASLDNPADLVSRGVKADLISACGLWWSGPNYLQNPPSTWPSKPNERRDLPEVAEDANLTSMQRYRRVQALKQHFWKRFAHEYISLLQEKNKWPSGDGLLPDKPLVLIRDKTAPPLLWPLGRIMKTYPGVDGVSRVADIKTKKGTLRRGFNNICVLPLDF